MTDLGKSKNLSKEAENSELSEVSDESKISDEEEVKASVESGGKDPAAPSEESEQNTKSDEEAENHKSIVVSPIDDSQRELVEQTDRLAQYLQTAEGYESYINRRSRTRTRRKIIQFFSFVVLVTLVAGIYYGKIASNRYVSVFQFTIESSRNSAPNALQGLLGQVAAGTTNKETDILSEYLRSSALLAKLDEWLEVESHFKDPAVDFISRLPANASREEFLEYYRNFVEVDTTTTPNVVTVKVQAYDPDFANAIGDAMVALSEDLINRLNVKVLDDAILYSKSDLKQSEERLSQVQQRLQLYQNKEGELDPIQSATRVSGIIGMLEAQLAQTRSQLTETLSFMRPESIQAVTIKAKISALQKQINEESAKLAGSGKTQERNYTDRLSDFARIRMEAEFARKSYEVSLTALEIAKAEAKRKFSYIVAFVPATLPDSSTEPKRFFAILTAFLGSAVIFILFSFVWATIRDHIDS
jgi:capsular polysaccharide transport system permease protein